MSWMKNDLSDSKTIWIHTNDKYKTIYNESNDHIIISLLIDDLPIYVRRLRNNINLDMNSILDTFEKKCETVNY